MGTHTQGSEGRPYVLVGKRGSDIKEDRWLGKDQIMERVIH